MSAKRCQRQLKTDCIDIQWRSGPEACNISNVAEVAGTGTRPTRTESSTISSPVNAAFKTRVGFLVGALELGGAERWLISLLKYCDRSRIEWTGVGLVNEARADPVIMAEVQQYVPVLVGNSIAEGVVARSDVLIAQFVENLAAFTKGFRGRSILVSHMSGDWNAQMISAAARGASEFVAVSKAAARSFPAGRPVKILYSGADEYRVRANRNREDVRREWGLGPRHIAVGFVGRLAPDKKPQIVAEAVARLGGDFRSVFVGGGPFREEVVGSIISADPQAIFRPPASHVGDVFAALDCFVLASPLEGFSLALAEAWLAGIPTVATPVGAVNELEELHGRLTAPLPTDPTAADVAAAIRVSVCRDYGAIVARARCIVARCYTADIMAAEWTTYLNKSVSLVGAVPGVSETMRRVADGGASRHMRGGSALSAFAVKDTTGSGVMQPRPGPRGMMRDFADVRYADGETSDADSIQTTELLEGIHARESCERSYKDAGGRMVTCYGGGHALIKMITFPDLLRPSRTPRVPLRVGILTPSLQLGGAERWIIGLLQTLDRKYVSPVGVGSVLEESAAHFDPIVQQCRSFAPVYFGISESRAMLQACDMVVAWGLRELTAIAHGFVGPVIFVSHGGGAGDALLWTQETIRSSIPCVTDCVAVSEPAATAFAIDDKPREVTIVHNGVDESRCTPLRSRAEVRNEWRLQESESAIGYVGRFSPEKRPESAALAAASLGTPYRAVLVGDGWRKDATIALARSICPDVIISPPIEQIGDVFNALDCFVLASPAEGFSLALTEAWMCGVPTVATFVGAIPELERIRGPLVVPVPVDASGVQLARAVKRALSAKNRATVARAQAIAKERFTIEAMGRRWTEYLVQIATRWRHRSASRQSRY